MLPGKGPDVCLLQREKTDFGSQAQQKGFKLPLEEAGNESPSGGASDGVMDQIVASGQELAENRMVEVDQAGRENRRMEFIPLTKGKERGKQKKEAGQ